MLLYALQLCKKCCESDQIWCSAVTKRASSISGTMPDVFHACEPGVGMEPGLALIDEVGKRALTTAFIQVIDVQIDKVSEKNLYNCRE